MPIEHSPLSTDSDIKRIEEFANLQDSVILEGGKTINSISPWYSFDKGKGLITQGVGPCVGLATKNFLAHIPADKLPLSVNTEETGFLILVRDLQEANIQHIDLFSDSTDRSVKEMNLIKSLLEKAGFQVDVHLNKDQTKAWTIIVKDKQVHAFVL